MSAPRVFIDTNVLVSGVVFAWAPSRVLDAARSGAIEGAVSLHVLSEFREVLMRPHFGVSEQIVDALVEEIVAFCEVSTVMAAASSLSADPDDDPVVEAALDCGAPWVVTGDAHLLALEVEGGRFVTPTELLGLLGL